MLLASKEDEKQTIKFKKSQLEMIKNKIDRIQKNRKIKVIGKKEEHEVNEKETELLENDKTIYGMI